MSISSSARTSPRSSSISFTNSFKPRLSAEDTDVSRSTLDDNFNFNLRSSISSSVSISRAPPTDNLFKPRPSIFNHDSTFKPRLSVVSPLASASPSTANNIKFNPKFRQSIFTLTASSSAFSDPPPTKRFTRFPSLAFTCTALSLLVVATIYVFFITNPILSEPIAPLPHSLPSDTPQSSSSRHKSSPHHQPGLVPHHPPRPKLTLSPHQELAAVNSFILSLYPFQQNALPSHLDPTRPIDPDLVLGFDTTRDQAKVTEELEELVSQVWSRFPVILFSKYHSASSRKIKAILTHMNINPTPTIIDMDERPDYDTLLALLSRLVTPYLSQNRESSSRSLDDDDSDKIDATTEATVHTASELDVDERDASAEVEYPLLLLHGTPFSASQIYSLHERGELEGAIRRSGATIGGKHRKKAKGKHGH